MADLEPLPSRVLLSARDLIDPSNGFFHFEWSDDKSDFVWSGKLPEARIVQRLNRSREYQLNIYIMNFAVVNDSNRLICKIDGENVDLEFIDEYGMRKFYCAVPRSSRNWIDISMRTLERMTPSVTDGRRLGFAMSSLSVYPLDEIA